MLRTLARRYTDLGFCVLIFVLCYVPRAHLSKRSLKYSIDLEIYRAGGTLISNGVNPYNYSDGQSVRFEILRFHRDMLGWDFPPSLESWNFYAASNLPLTLHLFGLIHRIDPSPAAYKRVFMIADALLGVVAYLLVLRRWGCASRAGALFLAVLFSMNGALLKWGTITPEDKGIQTLLIFFVLVLMTPNKGHWARAVAVGVAVAAAASFKVLGIFFVPAALVWARRVRGRKGIGVVAATMLVFALAINGPYLPWMARLWKTRLGTNVAGAPVYASIWVYVYGLWPWVAKLAPNLASTLALGVLGLVQVIRRRMTWEDLGGGRCLPLLCRVTPRRQHGPDQHGSHGANSGRRNWAPELGRVVAQHLDGGRSRRLLRRFGGARRRDHLVLQLGCRDSNRVGIASRDWGGNGQVL